MKSKNLSWRIEILQNIIKKILMGSLLLFLLTNSAFAAQKTQPKKVNKTVASSIMQTGSLKIKAGIVLKSRDVN